MNIHYLKSKIIFFQIIKNPIRRIEMVIIIPLVNYLISKAICNFSLNLIPKKLYQNYHHPTCQQIKRKF